MENEHAETQAKLRKAILDVLIDFGLGEEGGGFLKGYAMMVEWVGGDGRRWLTHLAADGVGDEIPDWQVNGYFHDFLHTAWPPMEESDGS